MTGLARVLAIVLRLGVCWPVLFAAGLLSDLAAVIADFCIWIEDHA